MKNIWQRQTLTDISGYNQFGIVNFWNMEQFAVELESACLMLHFLQFFPLKSELRIHPDHSTDAFCWRHRCSRLLSLFLAVLPQLRREEFVLLLSDHGQLLPGFIQFPFFPQHLLLGGDDLQHSTTGQHVLEKHLLHTHVRRISRPWSQSKLMSNFF